MFKKVLIISALGLISTIVMAVGLVSYVKKTLPNIASIQDYRPLLVSQVYDRTGKKIGEFARERRTLIPYEALPKHVVQAFLAAEDDQFFEHHGVNYLAILRATLANIRAGRTVQGGSTITQQVAKTFFLSSEKSFLRKAREALLAIQLEEHLSKEEILYLYLNQIYFGQQAYGIANAAETYFRKPVAQLTVGEAALLAGLPKAPSAYTPVRNPHRAKERQVYVLHRMAELNYITSEQSEKEVQKPLKVFLRERFDETAPFFLESVRQILIQKLGEEMVLDRGLKVFTSLDLAKQTAAQAAVVQGLKDLDKRQGYRGPSGNVTDPQKVGEFLQGVRDQLIAHSKPERIIQVDGQFQAYPALDVRYDLKVKGLPSYLQLQKPVAAIVSKVDDNLGLVYVRVAEIEGLIDFDSMNWARKVDFEKRSDLDLIKKPSEALKMGDLIQIQIKANAFSSPRLLRLVLQKKIRKEDLPEYARYALVELDQEPLVEGALLSLDQRTQEVLAMVGGYDFSQSKLIRTFQSKRQTGSSFKSIVYASALDKGYTAATPITDAPVVYEEVKEDSEGQEETKTWRPDNHAKSFMGDILFRSALARSLNIPTVKIIEDIKVDWAMEYARRLGIFSPLNPDFTLALGSSSVTLYEMTKVFSQFGRMGKRTRPILVHRVEDSEGHKVLDGVSIEERLQTEMDEWEKAFDKRRENFLAWKKLHPTEGTASGGSEAASVPASPPTTGETPTLADGSPVTKPKTMDPFFFFDDPDQLIRPQTAYLITSLLKATVEDKFGTGVRARALGREVAGKTGTTSNYIDAWFIGYTPQIATGVWVGFDQPKTLGIGEVGGRSALPIWVEYMKAAHDGLPQMTFPVPEGIVFANIDGDTGRLASPNSKNLIRQAFLEGTEPSSQDNKKEDETDFYRRDLSE